MIIKTLYYSSDLLIIEINNINIKFEIYSNTIYQSLMKYKCTIWNILTSELYGIIIDFTNEIALNIALYYTANYLKKYINFHNYLL